MRWLRTPAVQFVAIGLALFSVKRYATPGPSAEDRPTVVITTARLAMLEADAPRVPGLRLLPGRFMAINQAMGTPRGREAGARYLGEFVEEMKASGFVAQSLARNRAQGASVAPAGAAQ